MFSGMTVLPMFPLGAAFLPGELVPLRVFEPRYRRLLRDCVSSPDGPLFGSVLIARGHEVGGGDVRHDVGVRMRILDYGTLPTSAYELECRAEGRIRVIRWLPDDPYPKAEVEPWPDEDSEPIGDAAFAELIERICELFVLVDRFSEMRNVAPPPPPALDDLPEEPGVRLFALAAQMPMGQADRLQVLSAPGAGDRFRVLTESVENSTEVVRFRLGR